VQADGVGERAPIVFEVLHNPTVLGDQAAEAVEIVVRRGIGMVAKPTHDPHSFWSLLTSECAGVRQKTVPPPRQ